MREINNKQPQFQKRGVKYYLGLDLGISSVGWAVMAEDTKTNEYFLHDFGVRLFDVAEDPKSGETDNQKRRQFRSQRRLIRRRAYRIKKVKRILAQNHFMSEEEFDKKFNSIKSTNKIFEKNGVFFTEKGFWNPLVLKNKGVKEKLEKWEIYAILINYCKKRGYLDQWSFTEQGEKQQKSKFKKVLEKSAKATKSSYISEFILKNSEFRIDSLIRDGVNEFLIYIKNGKFENGAQLKEKEREMRTLSEKQRQEKLKKQKEEKNQMYRYLFSRKLYSKELEAILDKQTIFYPELAKVKKDMINPKNEEVFIFQQRDFEEGPICKNHNEKHCKRKNADCSKWKTFFEMIGNCPYFPEEKRGFKSSLIFNMYFFVTKINNFLSYLQNVKEEKPIKFEKEIYQTLLKKFLTENWQKKEIKNYLKNTKIWKERGSDIHFKSESWKHPTGGVNLEEAYFLRELRKIKLFNQAISQINFEKEFIPEMEKSWIEGIGKIVSQNITRKRRRNKLIDFLNKKHLALSEQDMEILENLENKVTTTAQVSFAWMKKVIEDFLKGENTLEKIDKQQSKEIELSNYKNNFKNKNIKKPKPKLFDKIVDFDLSKNPIVFRAVNQTRKVLKALFQEYGNFKQINIEVGRDMARTKKDRDKIEKHQRSGQEKNIEIWNKIKSRGRIGKKDILAYKLWEDQQKECLYCGIKITEESVLPREGKTQVDHIIPFSKLSDDSYNNKVLVCISCNQKKGNLTAAQFVKKEKNWDEYIQRIDIIKPKRFQKDGQIIRITKGRSWIKYNYLRSFNPKEFEDFISRNLNDTRYITKYIMGYVKTQLEHFKQDKNYENTVLAIPGQVTSALRRSWLEDSPWGLDVKVRDITPFHHAIDAIVLAQIKGKWEIELATDFARMNQYSRKIKKEKNPYWLEKTKEDLREFIKSTKEKWNRREKERFIEAIKGAEKTQQFKMYRISNLENEIETRMPVIMTIEWCANCSSNKKTELNCTECLGKRRVPKFQKLLNEDEWKIKTKELKEQKSINLRYPIISYMTNYKIKNDWASSEVFGFKEKEKNHIYKEWLKEKNFVDEKNEKWNEWKKQFESNEGFIFNAKTGNIIPTDEYYGFFLTENKKIEWIRKIDALNMKKEKNDQLISNRKNLVIKGVNICYFDKKKNKYLLKNFRGKAGEQINIHPNQLTYVQNFNKNKKIFGDPNYYDQTNNIKTKNFKIFSINILGYLV